MTSPTPFVDGYRLIDGTELNAVTANPQWSISPAVTATAGGSLTNSIRLTDTLSVVSVASAPNAGVVLPAAKSGVLRVVQNASANDIVVFAQGGSTVDGLPGNIGQTIPPGLTFWFVGTSVNSWAVMLKTLPSPASTSGTLAQFAATTSAQLAGVISDETGTGKLVFADNPTLNSPALVTPALGTPASGTLTNCSGLPIGSGVSGLGTGVAGALAVNVGTAGAPVVNGGALGTPSSGTLSNCSGLPISGIASLGAGVGTFLATPSSANLAAAVTGETGSGALVFGTAPTLSGVNLGAGTVSVAPLTIASGTNLTTPAAGALEYDGTVFYKTPAANNRGVVPVIHFVALTGSRTLAANTTAQAIFAGGGGPTNGALTVPAGTFDFEMLVQVSGLSTSAHTIFVGFAGTATIASIAYTTTSNEGNITAFNWVSTTAAASQVGSPGVTYTTGTYALRGMIRVSGGGTIIPQITQGTNGAAANVLVNSYWQMAQLGNASAAMVGNWS